MHACVFPDSLTITALAESQQKVILINRLHDRNLLPSMSSRRTTTSSPPLLTCAAFHMCLRWKTQKRVESQGAKSQSSWETIAKKTPVLLPLVVLLKCYSLQISAWSPLGWDNAHARLWESDNARLEHGSVAFFLHPGDARAREGVTSFRCCTALSSGPDWEGSVQSQPHYYLALHPHNR